jgi:beta-galactosidase
VQAVQLHLPPEETLQSTPPPKQAVCTLTEHETCWILATSNAAASVAVDKTTGCITSFRSCGRELISEAVPVPISPCLYRASTDNDRGGSKGSSYAARWKAAGLDRMRLVTGSCILEALLCKDGQPEIKCSFTMRPAERNSEEDAAEALVEGVGVGEVGGMHWLSENQPGMAEEDTAHMGACSPEGSVHCTARYSLRADGSLLMRWKIDATEALPAALSPGLKPSLPRVGLRMGLPGSAASMLAWYGRGPHECYPDREHSALLRLHTKRVLDMHVPYIFPSENGGRTDVRWVAVVDKDDGPCCSPGLLVVAAGKSSLQISASPYSLEALERARHDHELVPNGLVNLHLDCAHMGLGGDDSWSPTVHDKYLVPPKEYCMDVVLLPIPSSGMASEIRQKDQLEYEVASKVWRQWYSWNDSE